MSSRSKSERKKSAAPLPRSKIINLHADDHNSLTEKRETRSRKAKKLGTRRNIARSNKPKKNDRNGSTQGKMERRLEREWKKQSALLPEKTPEEVWGHILAALHLSDEEYSYCLERSLNDSKEISNDELEPVAREEEEQESQTPQQRKKSTKQDKSQNRKKRSREVNIIEAEVQKECRENLKKLEFDRDLEKAILLIKGVCDNEDTGVTIDEPPSQFDGLKFEESDLAPWDELGAHVMPEVYNLGYSGDNHCLEISAVELDPLAGGEDEEEEEELSQCPPPRKRTKKSTGQDEIQNSKRINEEIQTLEAEKVNEEFERSLEDNPERDAVLGLEQALMDAGVKNDEPPLQFNGTVFEHSKFYSNMLGAPEVPERLNWNHTDDNDCYILDGHTDIAETSLISAGNIPTGDISVIPADNLNVPFNDSIDITKSNDVIVIPDTPDAVEQETNEGTQTEKEQSENVFMAASESAMRADQRMDEETPAEQHPLVGTENVFMAASESAMTADQRMDEEMPSEQHPRVGTENVFIAASESAMTADQRMDEEMPAEQHPLVGTENVFMAATASESAMTADQHMDAEQQPLVGTEHRQAGMKTKRWSEDEQKRFKEGLDTYGEGRWKEIAEFIGTRDSKQVASHAQKYFIRKETPKNKCKRRSTNDGIIPDPNSQLHQPQDHRTAAPLPHQHPVAPSQKHVVPFDHFPHQQDVAPFNPPLQHQPVAPFSQWQHVKNPWRRTPPHQQDEASFNPPLQHQPAVPFSTWQNIKNPWRRTPPHQQQTMSFNPMPL